MAKKSKPIASAARLSAYSKPVLVELVLEVRDRLEEERAIHQQTSNHVKLLMDRLYKTQNDLKQVRKESRLLKKGGPSA